MSDEETEFKEWMIYIDLPDLAKAVGVDEDGSMSINGKVPFWFRAGCPVVKDVLETILKGLQDAGYTAVLALDETKVTQ